MSLKPVKKSDSGKPWMPPRLNSSRKVMISPPYHLIITEGTETEPKYFETIRDIINEKHSNRIKVEVKGEGDNTVNLFNKAQRIVQNAGNYSHVWIVYDKDDFPANNFNRVVDLCVANSNDEVTYHAIWSNQCIELWYLLHFDFWNTDTYRPQYYSKLTAKLRRIGSGEYRKNRDDIFDILKPYMDTAIKNAKKLEEYNIGKTPYDSSPGTKVYELIEELKPYL